MAKLSQIKSFLDKELKIKSIKDISRNGLQVKSNKEIKKIGFAVDGSISTFEKAKKQNIDLLIVHHGIKWKKQKYVELAKRREKFLLKNNISLYGVHLPLDAHSKYGNNIELCKILNLDKTKKFGNYHGVKIGYSGIFKKTTNVNEISKILNKQLKTKCNIINFGNKQIKSIAIVSGGGASATEEARKFDCFLLGEIDLGSCNRARDYQLNIIAAGHYATETLGVKALIPLLKEKFKVETIFLDNPINL
jgi:dinuclear metal center YbgI/SA1388 family protein|tara:strand:+ start:268 stop:1014 length:747 start_codon:yes stop_codon:yes gene_type:complete